MRIYRCFARRVLAVPGILFLLLALSSCMEDDLYRMPGDQDTTREGSGVFIVNEGNFMYGNASLSYYDPLKKEVLNDIFFLSNGFPLGDVAQSMTIHDSLGYIVMNNSGKVQVIDIRNFSYAGKITGLTSPRYMHFIDDQKAYVTDLYARAVSVVDPAAFEESGSIDVNNGSDRFLQHSTEQMVRIDRFVFTNCWSFDNKVLVIDSETDRVVDSIEVLKQPNSLVVDRYNALWVLCDGGLQESPYGYEAPGLMKVEAGSQEAEIVFRFPEGDRPSDLVINGRGDTLYFLNRDVYRLPVNSSSPPERFIRSPYDNRAAGGYYGLGVDPSSSEIYVADAIDFVQRGLVYRFRADGSPVDTFSTGIVPGSFCFTPR